MAIPNEIKKINGTYRSDLDKNKDVPFTGVSDLTPPQKFTRSQKKIFNQLVRELGIDGYNLLTTLDSFSVGMLAEVYDEYLNITKIIEKEGSYINYIGSTGKPSTKAHPLLAYKRQVFTDVIKLLKEFGLTPVSRNKVQYKPITEGNNDDWNF